MLTRQRYLSILFFSLVLFLYTPRIPILTDLEGSTSIRFDTLTNLLFGLLILVYIFSFRLNKYLFATSIIIFAVLMQGISPLSAKVVTTIHYLALLNLYSVLQDLSDRFHFNLYKVFKYFTLLNILLHSVSFFTGLKYAITTDLGENIIAGPYGILHAPYNFALLVFSGILIEFKRTRNLYSPYFIFLLFNLAIADSRVSFGAGLLCIAIMLYQNGFLKKSTILTFSILCGVLAIGMSTSLKTFTLLNSSNVNISSDPSLGMRLVNLEKYLNWVSSFKFIFGGGARIYTTFVTQYGLPGPFDNLYLRILSEAGMVGISIFLFSVLRLTRKVKRFLRSPLFALCVFQLIFGFFNESLLSIKGGQIVIISAFILIQNGKDD